MGLMSWGRYRSFGAVIGAALALGGCGSSGSASSVTKTADASTPSATTTPTTATPAPPVPAPCVPAAVLAPRRSEFPPVKGRTLAELAKVVQGSVQFGAATGTFTPGTRRLAFALNSSSGAFLYAPTAVYLATGPNARDVQGPFLAPADPMSVAPQYRSQQNAGPGGIQAIYAAQVRLPHAGTFAVLTLSATAKGLIGAPGEVAVAAASPIPDVGQRAPAIATDTAGSVHGDIALLTTRRPPESMHAVSLDQVLGKRPVALIFSTPQLCTSRVCGPVTDIAVSLQKQFAGRIDFIHEEVYVDNQPSKGLRPQMKAFHLQTEPWLFAINRHGVIVSRLEGAFGVNALRAALEAALR
jgi:hypothetical protein